MSDIRLAFAHPEERSLSLSSGRIAADPRDRISLRDHIVAVDIGAFQQERGQKQRVMFNVVVEVGAVTHPLDDDVDRILSYDRIIEAIDIELSVERLNLLETLAERVAERILAEPQAQRVFVRIEKLDLGDFKLGVEIVRSRVDAAPSADALHSLEAAIHPQLVFFDNERLAAPDIGAQVDAVIARSAVPVVFTVDLPDFPRGETGHRPTQRRIDLLAIEQNAWTLAARSLRCKVVATRTEIDWAIKHGQSVIWAPSKMALDAVDGPKTADALGLALWLAAQISARGITLCAAAPSPVCSGIPITRQ